MCLSQKNSCNLHLEVIKGQLLGSSFIQQLSFRTCAKLFQKKVALKIVSHLLFAHILYKRDQIDIKAFKALFSSPSPTRYTLAYTNDVILGTPEKGFTSSTTMVYRLTVQASLSAVNSASPSRKRNTTNMFRE